LTKPLNSFSAFRFYDSASGGFAGVLPVFAFIVTIFRVFYGYFQRTFALHYGIQLFNNSCLPIPVGDNSPVELTKEKSNFFKTIAIFMMLWHHLFYGAVQNKLPVTYLSIPIGDSTVAYLLGGAFLIFIVGIFAFLSGYGFSFTYQNKTFSSVFVSSIKKAIEFLLFYWLILLVFYIPFFVSYENSTGVPFDYKTLFLSFLGIGGFINPFAWYIYFYVFVLLFFPFYSRLFKFNLFTSFLFSLLPLFVVLLLQFVFHYSAINDYLSVFSCLCLGYIFGKFKIFTLVLRVFTNKKWLLFFCSFFVVVTCSLSVWKWSTDALFLVKPFAVVSLILAISLLLPFKFSAFFSKAVNLIGGISMNLWLLHGLIFSEPVLYFVNFLWFFYLPRISIFIFLFVFSIFGLLSWGCLYIDKRIAHLVDCLFLKQ
jgi:hypothetical protein